MQINPTNIPSFAFQTHQETISIETLTPGGEKFDRQYTFSKPAGKKGLGIIGWGLTGNNYTKCSLTKLQGSYPTTGNWTIVYSIRNAGDSNAGPLTLYVYILTVPE